MKRTNQGEMDNEEKKLQHPANAHEHPFDALYWETRWKKGETGWDTGFASPAITEYLAQYPNKQASILIPGCGNAHEAEYLLSKGFSSVTLIDISPKAVEILQTKFKNPDELTILCGDFFQHEGSYDLIIEQTFFCAISPEKRKNYSDKMSSLLNPNGKLIGVLFDRTFEHTGPPFGGNAEEYKRTFEPNFKIKTMEKCRNSVPSRVDSELFINLQKTQPTSSTGNSHPY